MNKPIVRYSESYSSMIEVGSGAVVRPIDHPGSLVSNTKHVHTSPVITYDPVSGVFETQNTLYYPESLKHDNI